MSRLVWSNKIEGNNLCYFCENYTKPQFFCTDPTDPSPVQVCRYFLPLGTPELERDLAMLEFLEEML